MRKSLLALSVVAALAQSPAHAGEVTQKQLHALEARIAKLEANEDALRKQAADATAAAQAAQAELAQIKGAATSTPTVAAQPATAANTSGDTTQSEIDALAATPAESNNETAQVAAPVATSGGSNANAFNPAISIILNGSYSHHSLDPTEYARAGFPLAGGAGPSPNGFSLGESELSLASNIDDKFYGQLTLTAESEDGQDHIGVEEAFVDTTSLPDNFSVRVGRFYSNIGYLNSHHAHTDNFFDRPLAYQAFLGNQYGDDGVQVRWVAPTSMFLELGGEMFRGQNYPSSGAQHGGIGTRTLFAHIGGDVGIENSWLAGVSVLKTQAVNGDDGFSGDNTLYIADGTWKWAPNGNTKDGGVTLRGEYFVDQRDGQFEYQNPLAGGPQLPIVTPWDGTRRGAYLEAVYRLNRTWDLGYRYDRLWSNGGPLVAGNDGFDPFRHSAELTWRNSEFSLVRLQLSHDKPNATDSDNAVTVQYQTSLGAHGAHKF